jgi:hypothetical protein
MPRWPSQDPESLFWKRVQVTDDDDGCWLWRGGMLSNGYGVLSIDYKSIYAHRYAFMLVDHLVTSEEWVLHSCDTPRFVRPLHLFLGNQAINMGDMAAKGRSGRYTKPHRTARGERNGRTRLTEDAVREIRRLRSQGMAGAAIARLFGTSPQNVCDIMSRRTWGHVP